MSFKIGFVQRHWVAFQVTGAMRWHDAIVVLPVTKALTLMLEVIYLSCDKGSMPAH